MTLVTEVSMAGHVLSFKKVQLPWTEIEGLLTVGETSVVVGLKTERTASTFIQVDGFDVQEWRSGNAYRGYLDWLQVLVSYGFLFADDGSSAAWSNHGRTCFCNEAELQEWRFSARCIYYNLLADKFDFHRDKEGDHTRELVKNLNEVKSHE